MKNIFTDKEKAALISRISKITRDHRPAWGKMNAHQMIVHLADPFRVAMGEKKVMANPGIFSKWPLNKLIIGVLPWPKGAPTAPEFIQGTGGSPLSEFEKDREELLTLVEKFTRTEDGFEFHASPVFGKLSRRDWGRLMWKHIDHHMRQFGC